MSDFYGRDKTIADAAREAGRCIVLHPYLKTAANGGRDPEASLEEAEGLAHAIGLTVANGACIPMTKPRPATLIGKGAVARFSSDEEETADLDADVIIVNATLTPVQQRNLEKAWGVKVIDRTGLILEIFGARASTKEGRLQVELAALTYQLGRLVRSWTHLERQRGGAGFMGGPGETQIEVDRRLIRQRIGRLKRELAEVKRTRHLQRSARKRVPYPVVALVGYTNAGKSTLFNRLTGADVIAQDQLFATLDPTMRRLQLPGGTVVILSDTVGFVSDLPHELVNAFHATLEEVISADLIVHVRDASHPDCEAQRRDVIDVLAQLGIEEKAQGEIIEVFNKSDRLSDDSRAFAQNQCARSNQPCIVVSALTGEGLDDLLDLVTTSIGREFDDVDVHVDYKDGRTLAWLYDHGEVLKRVEGTDGIDLIVRMNKSDSARLHDRLQGRRH